MKNRIFTDEKCLTPENTNGECVPLRECEQLFNIVLNNEKSAEEQNIVQRSLCGPNARDPQVIAMWQENKIKYSTR